MKVGTRKPKPKLKIKESVLVRIPRETYNILLQMQVDRTARDGRKSSLGDLIAAAFQRSTSAR